MNSFILINGIAFWVLLIFLILQFFIVILLGNAYIKQSRELDIKDRKLKKLRAEYNFLIGEYHRATFKLPVISKENANEE